MKNSKIDWKRILWKSWLEKFTGGDLGKKPEYTSVEEPKSTLQRGAGNRATLNPNKEQAHTDNVLANIKGRERTNPVKTPRRGLGHEQANPKRGREEDSAGNRGKEPSYRQQRPKRDVGGKHMEGSTAHSFQNKSYGKPLYGATSLEKEGDGAGNSGINSLESTGVYNPRYSDSKGRYKDQERDQ